MTDWIVPFVSGKFVIDKEKGVFVQQPKGNKKTVAQITAESKANAPPILKTSFTLPEFISFLAVRDGIDLVGA